MPEEEEGRDEDEDDCAASGLFSRSRCSSDCRSNILVGVMVAMILTFSPYRHNQGRADE